MRGQPIGLELVSEVPFVLSPAPVLRADTETRNVNFDLDARINHDAYLSDAILANLPVAPHARTLRGGPGHILLPTPWEPGRRADIR